MPLSVVVSGFNRKSHHVRVTGTSLCLKKRLCILFHLIYISELEINWVHFNIYLQMESLPWYFPFLALCFASVELIFQSCIYLNGFSYSVIFCEAKNNNLGNKMEFVGWWWHLVGVLILFVFFNIFIKAWLELETMKKS